MVKKYINRDILMFDSTSIKIKLNSEILEELGFIRVPNLIQESFELVLENEEYEGFFGDSKTYHYRSICIVLCNDKGLGEYYLWLKEGDTLNRYEDKISTITKNLLYKEDLVEFIRIAKL